MCDYPVRKRSNEQHLTPTVVPLLPPAPPGTPGMLHGTWYMLRVYRMLSACVSIFEFRDPEAGLQYYQTGPRSLG